MPGALTFPFLYSANAAACSRIVCIRADVSYGRDDLQLKFEISYVRVTFIPVESSISETHSRPNVVEYFLEFNAPRRLTMFIIRHTVCENSDRVFLKVLISKLIPRIFKLQRTR